MLILVCVIFFSSCASEKDILKDKQLEGQKEFAEYCDYLEAEEVINNLQKEVIMNLFEMATGKKDDKKQTQHDDKE